MILRTCVVADDNPSVRSFITQALSPEHFRVLSAANGREAAALIAAQQCDLLVTDLAMPGGEGIETIRALRPLYPELKILAITGEFGENMLRTARFLGADASLEKPFGADMLIATVRALFEPPA